MFRKKDTPQEQGGEVLKKMADIIMTTFSDFNVPIEIVEVVVGYKNYHFYLQPKQPVRMKVMESFLDDLKYALSCDDVEIQAPVPNEKYVGVTVPKTGELPLLELTKAFETTDYAESTPLTVLLGVSETSASCTIDLAHTPHLLIGGITGSGKSTLIHTIINSLIEKNSPDELRLILCDPKKVELMMYKDLPYLLTDPISQPKKATMAFKWLVKEMERRYDLLESEKVSDISTYHEKVFKPAKQRQEKTKSTSVKSKELPEPLPYLVVVVDEISDFMQAYPKEFEASLLKVTQMGRAVGIHLILTTQRPTASVITSSISANLPARIAMSVASYVDSRTIIFENGAEKLQNPGEMLLLVSGEKKPLHLYGYHVSEEEIKKRVKKWVNTYKTPMKTLDLSARDESSSFFTTSDEEEEDELYEDAKQAVIAAGKASTSYLQRKLRIGYSRTARLMDLLEERGVIGPQEGSKPREVFSEK